MVMVLLAQEAVTPAGKPVAVPMPVAPVVVMVILGESAVLKHTLEGAGVVAVMLEITVIVPVAFAVPQPVSGIV